MDLIAWYQSLGVSGQAIVKGIVLRRSSRISYRRDEIRDVFVKLEGKHAVISAGDTRKLLHWLENNTERG